MSVAGRKKSVASSTGLQIETPVAHNTFLNKSAASSTSLYQQCSQLRARLLRVYSFPPYFAISANPETRTSIDPVTQLWDCFALGVPLCFLHNLLPNVVPITNVETDPESIDTQNGRAIKKAIVHFAMAIGNTDLYDQTDQFTATQLLDRSSTEGFVVNCVTRLVDRLPDDCFQEAPPMSPPSSLPSHESTDSLLNPDSPMQAAPINAQENARNNIIREMVETERKYVQDLEHMQKYAVALNSNSAIDQDTIHLLFPGLNKLLDFQRRFLIKLEGVAELPWKEQRWGLHFIENEEEFAVYEPYCANYSHAMDILLTVESNLMIVALINAKSELPAFLIKPIQRICKYPLLLESLLKAAANSDYPYYDELQKGLGAAKRITDRINEAQRRSENEQTVASLEARVEDWKGHHLSNFGGLILEDVFMVMKMDIDREYHVFLFEKIILCCKEVVPATNGGTIRKSSKSNSILKKQAATSPGGMGPSRKKTTPLLLKGRIFLNNVTHTRHSITPGPTTPQYMLQVWWRGDDDNEYFTLRCRSEEQLNKWETAINRLIEQTQARRGSESQRGFAALQANSTNPSQSRHPYEVARALSSASTLNYLSVVSPVSGPSSASRRFPPSAYDYDDYRSRESGVPANGYSMASNGAGPSGYPQDVDFEPEEDYEEYPPAAQYLPSSGRGTPVGNRRGNLAQSMVQERDAAAGYDRPRARTEDQNGPIMRQWRKNGQSMPPPPPPPLGALPNPHAHLIRPQGPSRMASDASEASFGTGIATRTHPTLRSKFSSTRLNSSYDNDGEHAISPLTHVPSRPTTRSRSASQPSTYSPPPPAQLPPLPKSHWAETPKGSVASSVVSSVDSKRGSGSSESTGESSEYSPHSTSPITPFGSSDSSLAGSTLRTSRSAQMLKKPASTITPQLGLVKVKVHFLEDIFVIQVPRATEYEDLVEKVGKKIRLCGPRRDDGPLKVKYIDEDGDMVSLGSTEDVLMAFESMQVGNQVTLFVS
ncbi:hypothetical protein DFH11DRAFT_1501691 [Phellopilus nigrolimitatus]|nr:hypothetical protein DFH11DRAFT_1501691 [Phellopilus nigrolimitatus]